MLYKLFFILVLTVVLLIIGFFWVRAGDDEKFPEVPVTEVINVQKHKDIVLTDPELSGWVPYWLEKEAYGVVGRHMERLNSVSPYWFKLGGDLDIIEVGSFDKLAVSQDLKMKGILIYPMLSNSLGMVDFTPLARDGELFSSFCQKNLFLLSKYKADGLDLDFEEIGGEKEADFSNFVVKLKECLQSSNLKLIVSVQSQGGDVSERDGVRGQNFKKIGEVADFVRIMIYDKHGSHSGPGAISPNDWYERSLVFGLKTIPREKIVVGLPTYGYLWVVGGFNSFTYKNFVGELKGYLSSRDNDSSELVFRKDGNVGFLADSISLIDKINIARGLGLNKFVFWSLAGIDEAVFEKVWDEVTFRVY